MELISKNPFRIVGLIADITEKDLQRQRAKLNALINVGKEISSEMDFPFLPIFARDESLITASFALVET